jgi:type IV secretion system protein TrbG
MNAILRMLWCWVWVAACASAPRGGAVEFVPAQRMQEPAPDLPSLPPTVSVTEQTLVPGMYTPLTSLKRVPDAATKPDAPSNPAEVIAAANRAATSAPTSRGYFNAVQQYAYVPGMTYQIYCALSHTTDIALQPGERHIDPLVIGDSFRWTLGTTKSAVGGVEQEHVTVRPIQSGLHTNLTVHTNRRTYFLELHSYEDETYMVGVEWLYAQDDLTKQVAKANEQVQRERSAITLNPAALNFHYVAEILQGDPDWVPRQVFDDGRKTYIRFPPHMSSREAPVLFVVRDGELQLLNYYPKGEFYVADRVFTRAELRVGQQRQEIVRIERTQ